MEALETVAGDRVFAGVLIAEDQRLYLSRGKGDIVVTTVVADGDKFRIGTVFVNHRGACRIDALDGKFAVNVDRSLCTRGLCLDRGFTALGANTAAGDVDIGAPCIFVGNAVFFAFRLDATAGDVDIGVYIFGYELDRSLALGVNFTAANIKSITIRGHNAGCLTVGIDLAAADENTSCGNSVGVRAVQVKGTVFNQQAIVGFQTTSRSMTVVIDRDGAGEIFIKRDIPCRNAGVCVIDRQISVAGEGQIITVRTINGNAVVCAKIGFFRIIRRKTDDIIARESDRCITIYHHGVFAGQRKIDIVEIIGMRRRIIVDTGNRGFNITRIAPTVKRRIHPAIHKIQSVRVCEFRGGFINRPRSKSVTRLVAHIVVQRVDKGDLFITDRNPCIVGRTGGTLHLCFGKGVNSLDRTSILTVGRICSAGKVIAIFNGRFGLNLTGNGSKIFVARCGTRRITVFKLAVNAADNTADTPLAADITGRIAVEKVTILFSGYTAHKPTCCRDIAGRIAVEDFRNG